MGENELLYYNAMFTIFPLILLSFYSGEIEKVIIISTKFLCFFSRAFIFLKIKA